MTWSFSLPTAASNNLGARCAPVNHEREPPVQRSNHRLDSPVKCLRVAGEGHERGGHFPFCQQAQWQKWHTLLALIRKDVRPQLMSPVQA